MICVVIVSYCSGDVIGDCLESLLKTDDPDLRIVVCENASIDDTVERIRDWAAASEACLVEYPAGGTEQPALGGKSDIILLHSAENLGFAGGVNFGIRAIQHHEQIDLFWILNPDCIVPAGTPSVYAREATTGEAFSLMGGRILYHEAPNRIQSDGGRINPWTGVCRNVNQGGLPGVVELPNQGSLDFISGANVVASRAFIESKGLMEEDYFLYYEEVDWAMRRGDLPLKFCPEALVYHHGGTSIGTGSVTRRASGFANYFNYRNRLRYVWRFNRVGLLVAYLYSMLKIGKLVMLRAWDEAAGAFCGLHGLRPPEAIRKRLPANRDLWGASPVGKKS